MDSNLNTIDHRSSSAYAVLAALFSGSIVAANLMGTKVIPFFSIGGFEFSGSVGIFLFPLTFLITDIVAEIYGSRATRAIVDGTLLVLLLVLAVTAFATVATPADRFLTSDDAYVTVFRSSLRLIAASIVAFALSQYHDVWAFSFWKRITRGRFLWLRNNASTIVSQLIDTTVFMLIAFWGVNERFTIGYVLGSMVPPYYALKVVAAFLDTPLVYAGVSILRNRRSRTSAVRDPA